ncbi:MAG: hypothetical protein QNJ85_20460 [Gammaproteobacteria bacterium]|nr:hypothetical protein [Gammaproteobacteria bacterium]
MSRGYTITGWFRGLLFFLLLSVLLSAPRAQDFERLVIVRSSDNAFFRRTIDTLLHLVGENYHHEVIDVGNLAVDASPADLYIGLGLPAIEAIADARPAGKAIHAYLTEEQFHRLELAHNHFCVVLDQPLLRYLAFTRYLLDASSVGILTDLPVAADPRRAQSLEQLELELSLYRVDGDRKLLPVLRQLLRERDALLMLPRQSIYNPESLKGVLLSSYRQRRPVVSYSPAHVRAGALASIFSSPEDIGRHLAILVRGSLESGSSPRAGFHYARHYSISINRQVAGSLGLDLPSNAELRGKLDGLGW